MAQEQDARQVAEEALRAAGFEQTEWPSWWRYGHHTIGFEAGGAHCLVHARVPVALLPQLVRALTGGDPPGQRTAPTDAAAE